MFGDFYAFAELSDSKLSPFRVTASQAGATMPDREMREINPGPVGPFKEPRDGAGLPIQGDVLRFQDLQAEVLVAELFDPVDTLEVLFKGGFHTVVGKGVAWGTSYLLRIHIRAPVPAVHLRGQVGFDRTPSCAGRLRNSAAMYKACKE